jgi:FkbM family methyltransferase
MFIGKPRRLIRKLVRNVGFQRRIAPDFVDIMNDLDIDVVFDVGANDGGFGRDIRDRGYMGQIVSFEPFSSAYNRLCLAIRGDSKWKAYPIALGSEDTEVDINIADNDVLNSIKPLNDFGLGTAVRTIGKERIKVMKLGAFLKENPQYLSRPYLKIDTQGYELEVLEGVGDDLNRILAVQAEISLIHSYKGEVDYLDFLIWMRRRKFELATAVCNSSKGARVREFDFVFVNCND